MLIATENLLGFSTPGEEELATLEKILENYKQGQYNEVFILIMNYLGHVKHYCSHEGLVYRMLNMLTDSIEKKEKGILSKENDEFEFFINRRIDYVKEAFIF